LEKNEFSVDAKKNASGILTQTPDLSKCFLTSPVNDTTKF